MIFAERSTANMSLGVMVAVIVVLLGLNVNCVITKPQTKNIVRSAKTEYRKGVTTMANELKPCPFCEGEPKVFACDGAGSFYSDVGTAQIMGRKLDHKLIRCQKCGIRTKAY